VDGHVQVVAHSQVRLSGWTLVPEEPGGGAA